MLRVLRRPELTLFAHVCARPDSELDLARGALIVAEAEYPGLDVAHYLELLGQLGAEARRLTEPLPPGQPQVQRLLRMLFEDLGFSGNRDNFYDPRNSFLNEVLERRTGIPITLAVILLEVGARAGVELKGVGFPGHFLVRAPARGGPLFVDPFAGCILGPAELRKLNAQTMGQDRAPDPRLLEPMPKAQILLRMLANLRAIYAEQGDGERLRHAIERMQILEPSEDLERQIRMLDEQQQRRRQLMN